jgi:hypothetical protein
LDRNQRNTHLAQYHNPLAHKLFAAGDYAVIGWWSPTNGYFGGTPQGTHIPRNRRYVNQFGSIIVSLAGSNREGSR